MQVFEARGKPDYPGEYLSEQRRESTNRRIVVYTFCLINICLSLSHDANKIKTLNIERA